MFHNFCYGTLSPILYMTSCDRPLRCLYWFVFMMVTYLEKRNFRLGDLTSKRMFLSVRILMSLACIHFHNWQLLNMSKCPPNENRFNKSTAQVLSMCFFIAQNVSYNRAGSIIIACKERLGDILVMQGSLSSRPIFDWNFYLQLIETMRIYSAYVYFYLTSLYIAKPTLRVGHV